MLSSGRKSNLTILLLRISCLIFKSISYFEFIFVSGVRVCWQFPNFIDLHVAVGVQLYQHHLLKRLSFPHCMFLPHLLKINWSQIHGFISGLSILFHWSICLFLCRCHCFNYCSFEVLSEDCEGYASCFFSFPPGLLCLFWVFYGSI